jgi:hypothetical protein
MADSVQTAQAGYTQLTQYGDHVEQGSMPGIYG